MWRRDARVADDEHERGPAMTTSERRASEGSEGRFEVHHQQRQHQEVGRGRSASLARLIAAGEDDDDEEVRTSRGERMMGLASCWPAQGGSLPADLRSKAPTPTETREDGGNGPTTAYLNYGSRPDHTGTEPQGAVGEGARLSGSDRLGIHFLLNPQTVLEDGRDHHLRHLHDDDEGVGQLRTRMIDRSENRVIHPHIRADEEEALRSSGSTSTKLSSDREESFTRHHHPSASAAKRHSLKPSSSSSSSSGRRSRGNGSPSTTEEGRPYTRRTREGGSTTIDGDDDEEEEEGAEEEGRGFGRNEAMRRSLNEKLKRRLDEKRKREAGAQERPVQKKKAPVGLVATKKELDIWEKLMLTSVIQPYLPSRSSPASPQRRASRMDHPHQAREAPPLRGMPSLSSSFQLLSRLGTPSADSAPPQIPEMSLPVARSAVGAIQLLGQHAQVVDLTMPSLRPYAPQQAMPRHIALEPQRRAGGASSTPHIAATERKRKRQENESDEKAVHRHHQHPTQAAQGMPRLVFHQVDFTPSHLPQSRGGSRTRRVPRYSEEDHQQHNQIACDGFALPPPAHAPCRASGRA